MNVFIGISLGNKRLTGINLSFFNPGFQLSIPLDMLCRQGRMNMEVAAFPNRAFYGGLLEPVGLPHIRQGVLKLSPQLCADEFAALLTRRVAFLPAVVEPPIQSAKMNRSEAQIVAGLAAAIYRQYTFSEVLSAASTLGVITPYRSQIALIKKEIEALGIAALNDISW